MDNNGYLLLIHKLEACLCKHPASAYTDKKYDSAYIINDMSDDDDDDPDHKEGQEKCYLCIRPSYLSDIVSNIP